jgi:hypothetical protein
MPAKPAWYGRLNTAELQLVRVSLISERNRYRNLVRGGEYVPRYWDTRIKRITALLARLKHAS